MSKKKLNYRKITLYEPLLGKEEKTYVKDCLNTNWISSKGKYVKMFEDKFKKFIKVKHAVSVCNGTAALHVALLALGIGLAPIYNTSGPPCFLISTTFT